MVAIFLAITEVDKTYGVRSNGRLQAACENERLNHVLSFLNKRQEGGNRSYP
jgi:hypothetical protein